MDNILPKISIVIITWGHQDFIEDTLDGIFLQDFEDSIELIISNDKSPDNTEEIITNYFNTHKKPKNLNLVYTNHDKNLGAINNFIWALQQAKGEYIAFCEGDDYWIDPLKIKKQIDILEKNKDYQMVFTNCNEVDEKKNLNKTLLLNKVEDSKEYTDIEIVTQWIIPTCSVLFKNNLSEDDWKILTSKKVFFGDIFLFLINANKGRIFGMSEVTCCYRIHSNSFTNKEKPIIYYENIVKHLEYLVTIYDKKYLTYFKGHIKNQALKNFKFFFKKANLKSIKYFYKYLKNA